LATSFLNELPPR